MLALWAPTVPLTRPVASWTRCRGQIDATATRTGRQDAGVAEAEVEVGTRHIAPAARRGQNLDHAPGGRSPYGGHSPLPQNQKSKNGYSVRGDAVVGTGPRVAAWAVRSNRLIRPGPPGLGSSGSRGTSLRVSMSGWNTAWAACGVQEITHGPRLAQDLTAWDAHASTP